MEKQKQLWLRVVKKKVLGAQKNKNLRCRKIIAKKQINMDSLEIRDGFPKEMWEHGVYIKEEYIKLGERESKYWKDE
jgi:hypothetical protein